MKKVTLLKKYCLVGLAGIIAASAIGCTSEDINLDKDEVEEDVSSEESSQDEENEKVEDNNTGSTDNSSDSEDGKDESDANTESTEDADVSVFKEFQCYLFLPISSSHNFLISQKLKPSAVSS